MLDFLKEFMRPSQIACILILLTPGAALLFVPPLARWGRRWVAAVVIFYLLLSSQAGAGLLARTLSGGYRPLASASEARGATVVVVLGAGSVNLRAAGRQLSQVTMEAGLRVLEVARLFELLDGPLVIASGGITEHDGQAAPESVAIQRALIQVGVRADRILLESESKNTRDEATIIKRMLAERGLTDFVLVTSPLHMRRSMMAFEQQGMHPIPSPSPLVPDRSASRSWLMPSDMWLQIGDSALYEWLARGYYWWRGWLR
jgi:uncharacterized SAM-binding protein YcdF (DUF218 family)